MKNTDLITPPEHFGTHRRYITRFIFLFCLLRAKESAACILSTEITRRIRREKATVALEPEANTYE